MPKIRSVNYEIYSVIKYRKISLETASWALKNSKIHFRPGAKGLMDPQNRNPGPCNRAGKDPQTLFLISVFSNLNNYV